MDEKQAKVHNTNKSKHRRAASSREKFTEPTSPTITTTPAAAATTTPITTPIVIVQSQSNDDDIAESPASSIHVNSKNVQSSGVADIEMNEPSTSRKNEENQIRIENDEAKTALFQTLSPSHGGKYSPKSPSSQKLPSKSLSDPTASPAQRSIRSSRSSNEKSPRQKRSKSESRRRRERKLIAAGEMEVRQANETLMRYLKQCSDITDASLSGELEIDKNLDDRYHKKGRSQRERNNAHHSSNSSIGTTGEGKTTKSKSMSAFSRAASFARERMPPSGLSNILQELTADIIPTQDEIYNPFTPVVSPTEAPRTDKMFIQTPRGFRSVSDSNFLKTMSPDDPEIGRRSNGNDAAGLSCLVQRIWILFANICHGLLAGLALAHILFIGTTTPKDLLSGSLKSYISSTEIYTNTFYCLAILCVVSILDRMDICRWTVLNANESISFRWIIVVMIYVATIILCLSSETFDERFYVVANNDNVNTNSTKEMEHGHVINIWSSLSLARSISAIIGWIMIGLRPTEDLLYDQLVEMEKYKVGND